MTDEQFGPLAKQLCGESMTAPIQQVNLGEDYHNILKVYIRTLRDGMMSLEIWEEAIANTIVEKLYDIDTGHGSCL